AASHFFKEDEDSVERLPSRSASTLMSSSKSGQCTPFPEPVSLQLARSCAVPLARRGYHIIGAEIDRPSVRCTINSSSLTSTSAANGRVSSLAEELIPCLQQLSPSLRDDTLNLSELGGTKAQTMVVLHRIE